MPHEYTKPAPELKSEINPIFAERLNRTKRAFDSAGFSYAPDDYVTRRKDEVELENQAFMREWPNCVRSKLISITRVLLSQKDMFEDKTGKFDNKVESALVFRVQAEILNEEALRKHHVEVLIDYRSAQHSYLIGRIETPQIAPIYKDGKLTAMKIVGFNHRYYIPDTPEQIKKILKEFGGPAKQWSVAIANASGPVYRDECVYSVFNQDEFINEPIDLLIDANKRGLLGERAGGIKAMREWKNKEKQLLESGAATEKELEKITKEDIMNILSQKKSAALIKR
jgi:hypothetical protein